MRRCWISLFDYIYRRGSDHVLKDQLSKDPHHFFFSSSTVSHYDTAGETEICIVSNLQQGWRCLTETYLFLFEPCSRADGPGMQPVWSGQWWYYRWVTIPGGCQVELWRRRGKKIYIYTLSNQHKSSYHIDIYFKDSLNHRCSHLFASELWPSGTVSCGTSGSSANLQTEVWWI